MSAKILVRPLCYAFALFWISTSAASAVDFHAFEFNEGLGEFLMFTTNSGNPGGQNWVESQLMLDSETTGTGSYRIRKATDVQADNYLQIDNITSATVGSRYLVVRMSGWNFVNNVPGEGEEIRFDFLDNDTGNSGSTITSQIRIDRNTDNGNIELRGTALGVGSTDIPNRATLNITQSAPFTMVLELNKTSNTYEVFYKDGTNPSQSLGSAPISPSRNGNSIRFTANNNFGSDLTEFFSIDRIALSDTNPLTDLMTLQIHRTTGEMKLINTTGSALSGLRSYSITSPSGALNPANWRSVTDFYDQPPQNGSVDPDGAWSKTSTTAFELAEGVIGGNGGNLSINQEVILAAANNSVWRQGIYEDLEITLNFDGGITRKANVNFIGNSGKRFSLGDLNFDGVLTAADWTAFNAGAETNISSLSAAQRYQAGDLNNDGFNDIFDFAIFKQAYDEVNGLNAFNAMIAGVPEPASGMLLGLASFALLGRYRRRNSRVAVFPTTCAKFEVTPMNLRLTVLLMSMVATLIVTAKAPAAILEDFNFSTVANGTTLAAVPNTGTGIGNSWSEETPLMNPSTVQGGIYRINKANNDFARNRLDINNVTSGKAWLVAEIAGWNLSSIVGPSEFDAAEPEEIRFAFLNNDDAAFSGSQITGQAQFQRNASGGFELVGRLLTTAIDTPVLPLTLNRTTPFTVAVEINEDDNSYSVYYKDNTNPFTLLGTAPHDATRNGNSLRFGVNNNFGGTGEFFDISRIYVTDTDPTNVSNDRLTLQVFPNTGELKLKNTTTSSTFDIDAYTITSSTVAGDLNFAGWSSLSDKIPLFDPFDGPDPGSTAGDGVGETWDEAPGSSNKTLAERFLLSSSVFPPNREVSLGSAFKLGGDPESLTFQYRNADTGAIVTGNIEVINTGPNGDYDGDGDVDGRDFLIWQRGGSSTAPLSPGDLTAWQNNYGFGTLTELQAVPEPTAILLMSVSMALVACRRR